MYLQENLIVYREEYGMNAGLYTEKKINYIYSERRYRLKCILFILCCCSFPTIRAQVTENLKAIGMENIRCIQTSDITTVSFEDNVYRGTYRGVGKAIEACLQSKTEGNLQLVVLENQIPRLCISLPDTLIKAYRHEEISLAQVYQQMGITVDTDRAMEALKEAGKEKASSAWKMDIVVYPDLFLENNTFDELYTYAINLNPAIEMALWKGGRLTAQVVLPVATNLSGEMKRVRPGVIVLSQDVRLRHNFFGRLTVGNFTNNRIGAQLEMKYRNNNGRMEFGASIGSTGFSAVTSDEGWYVSRRQRINASVTTSLYEPHTNLQFDLKASRYVYGDYGVRGDCTRHFGEYAIGLYGIYTDGEINGGFHFAIPLPGKKWSRKGFVRVKPSDYFAWSYSMIADGKYIEEKMGGSYNVRPGENRSSGFYQPDYIRYFLIRELQRKKSS
jgi:hypothetical protein